MDKKWDNRFLNLARLVSGWSKDPSTKCGAVITRGKQIVSVGFNGFPAGVDDSEHLYADRDKKYRRILHAEQNAILFAKQDLTGCTCYVYPMQPCSNCTAMLIQAGVSRIVSPKATKEQEARWRESFQSAKDMLGDVGFDAKGD